MKRINKNNLLPWFLEDHGQLPKEYLESCQRFFLELDRKAASKKQVDKQSSSAYIGIYKKG